MQAIVRIAAEAAKRVRRMVRWRPERIQAPEKPAQAPTQAPAPAQTPTAPEDQRQAPAAEVRMPEVPATERLARVYAAKVSLGRWASATPSTRWFQPIDARQNARSNTAEIQCALDHLAEVVRKNGNVEASRRRAVHPTLHVAK